MRKALLIVLIMLFSCTLRADDFSDAKSKMEAILGFQKPVPQVVEGVTLELNGDAFQQAAEAVKAPTYAATPKEYVLCVTALEWCGPCQADHKEHNDNKLSESVELRLLDLDKNRATANQLGVTGVPTYFLYRDNVLVKTHKGRASTETIKSWLYKPPVQAAPAEPVGAFNAGTLRGSKEQVKAFLDAARPFLAKAGGLKVEMTRQPKRDVEYVAGKAKILIPADLEISWRAEGTGVRLEFKPNITVEYGIINQRLRGVLVTEDKITADLPWMIDAEIKVQ